MEATWIMLTGFFLISQRHGSRSASTPYQTMIRHAALCASKTLKAALAPPDGEMSGESLHARHAQEVLTH